MDDLPPTNAKVIVIVRCSRSVNAGMEVIVRGNFGVGKRRAWRNLGSCAMTSVLCRVTCTVTRIGIRWRISIPDHYRVPRSLVNTYSSLAHNITDSLQRRQIILGVQYRASYVTNEDVNIREVLYVTYISLYRDQDLNPGLAAQ